ncbi:MAG TPA: ATP-grasp domain-containing protein [Candidatus Saccharimonadales bacterium]|nr:ATP-grasp domain-containing protein [Candidatus Saccharimonadales bacterium]
MASDQKLGTADLLFKTAQQMGLAPSWVTPLGTFAITVDGQERYVNSRSRLNSAASAQLAKNKYVTRRILERHDMPNIPFMLPHTQTEAAGFLEQYGTIIAKPVSGAGSRDIHIVTSHLQLEALAIDEYILEQYIAGQELRYLVLKGEIIGVHRSEYGTSVEEDRPLQRISYPKNEWDPALISASLRIADILNLTFAAVDFLIDATGRAYILEVNTKPGFKWFHAPSSGPVVDVARLFLESTLDDLRHKQPAMVGAHPHAAYSYDRRGL